MKETIFSQLKIIKHLIEKFVEISEGLAEISSEYY